MADQYPSVEVLDAAGDVAWVKARLPKLLPWGWRPDRQGVDGARYLYRDGLSVIVSGAVRSDGNRWLHVSCARRDRLPTWAELRTVKDVFIGRDVYAAQILPPTECYVNINPHVLHLFAPVDHPWPLPEMSGLVPGVGRSL